MKRTSSRLLKPLVMFHLYLYLLVFLALCLGYLSELFTFSTSKLSFAKIFWLFVVGISFSSLSSLLAWPLSLSVVTYLQQIKMKTIYPLLRKIIHFYASLPLVLFCFIYIEVIGDALFDRLQIFWTQSFAQPNLFTQALSFAVTILLYPLTLIPYFFKSYTVAEFLVESSKMIEQFAVIGLVSSVLIISLVIFILPQMINLMLDHFETEENQRNFEVVQSMGGTLWESVHMSVLQNMKSRFIEITLKFSRICFFEGLITFSVLHFFFLVNKDAFDEWGLSVTSLAVLFSFEGVEKQTVLHLSGVLMFCFLGLYGLEKWFQSKRGAV